MTDAAATTTRGRAARPVAEPTPGVKVQQAAVRAAEGVAGGHELGTPRGRAPLRAQGRGPGGRTPNGPGVSVEVGERKAAVDVSLVVEFGTPAPAVGGEVREAVREQVKRDTGLEVVEVNVTVVGLHHPDDDLPPEPEPVEAVDASEAAEGSAPAVDAGAAPDADAEREAGEEVERIVARAVEDGADQAERADGSDQEGAELTDAARTGAGTPTVVLATGDGEAPDVVVADQVVVADSVVVVDPQQDEQEQARRQD